IAGSGTVLDMGLKTAAGIYTVIGTSTANGCATPMTGSATINVNPAPPANSVTGGGTYCSGGTGFPIGLNGSVTGISYQLYLNGVAFGLPLAGTGGPFLFGTETLAGNYTVIGQNTTTGCTNNMT